MPLIRYRTGDLGAYPENDKVCECGRTLPIFKSVEGRKMSYLTLPDGRLVGSAALSTAFHAENILESQIIQDSTDSVKLKLVVTDNFKDSDREYLLSELNKRVFPLKINCECVDSIPGSNAKKQWIINNVCSAN
jgi:phenylacetate-CoA ligase